MKAQTIPDKLLTLDEVAEYLRLSIHTLYKMVQQERIPAFKVTNKWRFRKSEIDAWIEKNRRKNKRNKK